MSDIPVVNPYADVKERAPPRPELKRNPDPTPYEFTVTLSDAPGPFASVNGFMQYETKSNDPCMPDLGGMSGTRMRIIEDVPFALTKSSDGTYRGVIYPDLFVDHDYFGLGPCHIGFIAARVEFRISGEKGESPFIENLSNDAVASEKALVSGFLRRQYPGGTVGGAPVPSFREGTPMRARVKEEELFDIKLVAIKKR